MKKLLFALLLTFYITQAYSKQAEQPEAIKIAYIQTDVLMEGLNMYKDLLEVYKAKVAEFQNQLVKKEKTLEKEIADFNEKIGMDMLTMRQAEEVEARVRKIESELVQMRERAVAEEDEDRAMLMRKIKHEIKAYVSRYNEKAGYSLILTTSDDNMSVIYGLPSLDITQDILNGLNEEYRK